MFDSTKAASPETSSRPDGRLLPVFLRVTAAFLIVLVGAWMAGLFDVLAAKVSGSPRSRPELAGPSELVRWPLVAVHSEWMHHLSMVTTVGVGKAPDSNQLCLMSFALGETPAKHLGSCEIVVDAVGAGAANFGVAALEGGACLHMADTHGRMNAQGQVWVVPVSEAHGVGAPSKLEPPDGKREFGAAIAAASDIVAVGAPAPEYSLPGPVSSYVPGYVAVYRLDRDPAGEATVFEHTRVDVISNPSGDMESWASFGSVLAIDADARRLAVGNGQAGEIFVFQREADDTWTLEQTLHLRKAVWSGSSPGTICRVSALEFAGEYLFAGTTDCSYVGERGIVAVFRQGARWRACGTLRGADDSSAFGSALGSDGSMICIEQDTGITIWSGLASLTSESIVDETYLAPTIADSPFEYSALDFAVDDGRLYRSNWVAYRPGPRPPGSGAPTVSVYDLATGTFRHEIDIAP